MGLLATVLLAAADVAVHAAPSKGWPVIQRVYTPRAKKKLPRSWTIAGKRYSADGCFYTVGGATHGTVIVAGDHLDYRCT